MSGIQGALNEAVGKVVQSAESIDDRAEKSGAALLDRLGDKLFGPTAESQQTNNASSIAPDASITPVTQGRRSHRPDGQDPFHSAAPAPSDES